MEIYEEDFKIWMKSKRKVFMEVLEIRSSKEFEEFEKAFWEIYKKRNLENK